MIINGRNYPDVKRNILMNPGPATTTDTVKYAQVIPDICPREKEFCDIIHQMSLDLVKIVHGDPEKFVGVLFCGSGTMNIDVTVSSLVPAGKKILILNNGSYSARAVPIMSITSICSCRSTARSTLPRQKKRFPQIRTSPSSTAACTRRAPAFSTRSVKSAPPPMRTAAP